MAAMDDAHDPTYGPVPLPGDPTLHFTMGQLWVPLWIKQVPIINQQGGHSVGTTIGQFERQPEVPAMFLGGGHWPQLYWHLIGSCGQGGENRGLSDWCGHVRNGAIGLRTERSDNALQPAHEW